MQPSSWAFEHHGVQSGASRQRPLLGRQHMHAVQHWSAAGAAAVFGCSTASTAVVITASDGLGIIRSFGCKTLSLPPAATAAIGMRSAVAMAAPTGASSSDSSDDDMDPEWREWRTASIRVSMHLSPGFLRAAVVLAAWFLMMSASMTCCRPSDCRRAGRQQHSTPMRRSGARSESCLPCWLAKCTWTEAGAHYTSIAY